MKWWHTAVVICLVVGGVLSLVASQHPDGLERVAEDKGFAEKAEESSFEIMPDYSIPGITSSLSTSLAGVLGVLIMIGVVYSVGRILKKSHLQD